MRWSASVSCGMLFALVTVAASATISDTASPPAPVTEFDIHRGQIFDEDMKSILENDNATVSENSAGNATKAPAVLSGSHRLLQGFVSTFGVILVSEIADKTFFIAAIMAMRQSSSVVFAGAFAALVVMTGLGTAMGSVARLIPWQYTHYTSIILFVCFGLKMLYEAARMNGNEAEAGFEKVEQELDAEVGTSLTASGQPAGHGPKRPWTSACRIVFGSVFWQVFLLTFLSEWGDRSQFSTIILAAREDLWAVFLGAIAGHAVCTCLATIAGSLISKKVSVKALTYFGGFLFLFFAGLALVIDLIKS